MKTNFTLSLIVAIVISSCSPIAMEPEKPTQTSSVSTSEITIAGFEQKELTCSIYLETTWGTGKKQWGDPIQFSGHSRIHFPPLAFSETSDIYISDFPNRRLLKYDGDKQSPVQTITLPEQYYLDPQYSPISPWHIVVTQTNILVPYGLDKIGILSLDGQKVKDIQLPYRYNPMAPIRKPVWVDPNGRLLLNGEKIVYFDVGWDEGIWKEMAVGIDFIRNPQLWDGYLIGESGVQPNYYKYKIDFSKNFLAEPIELNVDLDIGIHILGIDHHDWIYFKKPVETEHTIIRYGLQSGAKQYGIVSDINVTNVVEAGVAPNGIIYLIVYEPSDQSIQPAMVKCFFSIQ